MFLKRFGPVYSFWMFHFERFNSWISRRVLNRRYPESTVVETYLLTEWAHFMELSGQLVEGVVTNLIHTESDDGCHDVPEKKMISLSEEQKDNLNMYYLANIPEYGALMKQYNEEKAQTKANHWLKKFPSISEWSPSNSQLTDLQLKLRSGPSISVQMLKQFTYLDSHRRIIKLSSVKSDCDSSYCCCSFVSSLDASPPKIGRILSLFEHTFLATASFAEVAWFDSVYSDSDSNLTYVLGNSQTLSIVPILTLSKPLVVAHDDEDTDKLWINI